MTFMMTFFKLVHNIFWLYSPPIPSLVPFNPAGFFPLLKLPTSFRLLIVQALCRKCRHVLQRYLSSASLSGLFRKVCLWSSLHAGLCTSFKSADTTLTCKVRLQTAFRAATGGPCLGWIVRRKLFRRRSKVQPRAPSPKKAEGPLKECDQAVPDFSLREPHHLPK